jgi:predicted secreted hydrolase
MKLIKRRQSGLVTAVGISRNFMKDRMNDKGNGSSMRAWLVSIAVGVLLASGFLLPAAYCLLPAASHSLLPSDKALPERKNVDPGGWREAAAGYEYRFPRDHAAHNDYKIEWWYYTGNLESASGRRFGYQLTFFRTGITAETANPSRWAVRDLYMVHFCISDIEGKAFHSFEKLNRAGIGWAGAASDSYRVWNEGWQAELQGREHLIKADHGDYQLDLRLTPEKPEVIHGENGISQKGALAGNASHYVSLSRLRSTGSIKVGGEAFAVSGLSWMDHEFGTSFLEQSQTGWDWFSIQLEDNRELMLFQIRRADGSIDPRSSGTLIEADGSSVHLPLSEFNLKPTGANWRSEASGASYPIAWSVELPRLNLRLKVKAAFENQELQTAESTAVTYWEGSVEVEGTNAGRSVKGRGYLEMTGYSGQNMGAIFQ